MANMNENPMQRALRERERVEHKRMVQAFSNKGYTLQAYMQMMNALGGPRDAEEYTEICEDFMEPTMENTRAWQNISYVEPTKYKINESQYIRIFRTPLSIEGRMFVLVKPKEHHLSKKTYYELAKIAVCAEHYLARGNIDETRGDVYAHQIALVDPEFLEPGKYKEICIYAAKANYRALKWMQYEKFSTQDFIDVFMATATHWEGQQWHGMNPAVFYLMDSDCPTWLRKACYVAFAEKYGFEELEAEYKRMIPKGTNITTLEIDHGMLSDVRWAISFREKQKPQTRRLTITQTDTPEWLEVSCDCVTDLEHCAARKYLKSESRRSLKEWDAARFVDNDTQTTENHVDAVLGNKSDLARCKRRLDEMCSYCKHVHNR